jgi:tetratricopeptide (TPR) repeat protein
MPSGARAEESAAEAKERALRAYKVGLDFYKREEWDKAIEQFEAGYKATPQAVFLFNIAQAQNKAGRPEQALAYYRRYLREAPSAPNRTDVEGRVAALEKQLGPGATLPKLFVPFGQPGVAGDAPEPPPAGTTPAPPKRKVWPIVLGVVGGALVVGAAVGLGVYFGTRQQTTVTVFDPVEP